MKHPNETRRAAPWILPVFIPHLGCPHRCAFCNQHLASRTGSVPTPAAVRTRLDAQIPRFGPGDGRRRQIAFYGGSFTGIDPGLQREYLLAVRGFLERRWIDSIRVSVRPDELQRDRVEFLRDHGVRTVEIGVQSLSDRVLEASRRGCTSAHAVAAIRSVQEAGLEAGAQIMAGLPGDTGRECMETVDVLCDVRPDFVRIHPLLVLPGTGVARLLRSGRYKPLDLATAVTLCAAMLARFRKAAVPVVRIGLHCQDAMQAGGGGVLAGPVHPAFGFLVRSFLYRQALQLALAGRDAQVAAGLHFRIHPDDRSLFSGYQRENLRMLQAVTGTDDISVTEDPVMSRGRVERIEPREEAATDGVTVARAQLSGRRQGVWDAARSSE